MKRINIITVNLKSPICFFAYVIISIALSACTALTVSKGGDGTVRIVEGGLVESMVFDGGTTLNIQITQEDVPEYDYLDQHILTIGKFSPVIGSGFTKRSNIYYESPIGSHGNDAFMVDRETFRVFWKEIDVTTEFRHPMSIFSVTISQVSF